MARKRKYKSTYVPKHGTKAGYLWHVESMDNIGTLFEEPCTACDNAFKAYWVEKNKQPHRHGGRRESVYHEKWSDDEVLAIHGTNCNECGKNIDLTLPRKVGLEGWKYGLHIDHYIPISRNGHDAIYNLRPTHAICNMRKSNRLRIDNE